MVKINRLKTKLLLVLVLGVVLLPLAAPTWALNFGENSGSRPGLLKNLLGTNKGRVALGTGTLKSKTGDSIPATLMVTKDGKDYTVNIDASTQLRRRFWGKATLVEFAVGDTINVIGQWANDDHTTVNAKLVRDASIQKRFGVFFGTISSGGGTSTLVVDTIRRGAQTVTVGSATKLVNRRGENILVTDLKNGDRIRVRGLWDSKANTITEVATIKDYNLPTKSAP